jgi:anti-sigma B factor antagonist
LVTLAIRLTAVTPPSQKREEKLVRIEQKPIESDIVLVKLFGRISLGRDCQDVEWAVDELIRDSRKKVVFDLTELDYLDSMGIGIIVMCCGRMKEAGGELRLASLQPRIADLMKMTRLDQIFRFYPTAAAAIEDFEIAP